MAGPQAPPPGLGWGEARRSRWHVSRVPVRCLGWRSSGSLQPRPSVSLFLLMPDASPRALAQAAPWSTGLPSHVYWGFTQGSSLASGPGVRLPSDVSTFTSLAFSRDGIHHLSKQAHLSPSASQDREVKVIPPSTCTHIKPHFSGAFPEVQWLRSRLAMQGTLV